MAVFKCKMCGGTLEIKNNETVAVCEYCGTKQTLPKLDDDRKANLYDRANHFRRNNEFDKAMGIYEQILNEDSTDAESYWSLVLCRYGIEYVEDPATHKRIPTVNRAQYTSIFDDEDYKSALQYADGSQKEVYEAEADAINEIQKGILAISGKEEPFDVFICYKETDQNGRRTPDSVLATELYHELTREGYKVFFSRITLEDKLGTAYEPYIFAALNSAKVMVVLGTKPEYFNAVWVKNEWNRYLALIKNGARKVLIPAFKDMDPYDLPEEFSHLQAQDMAKLGFMQDLIRGIKKLTQANEPKEPSKETVVVNTNTNIAPLLKRAFMFLEDGDFARADEFCEQVLNQDPENAEAYLGKLMADLKVRKQEDLADCEQPFDENNNYKKAMRFADEKLSKTLKSYILHINDRNENARLEGIYAQAVSEMNSAATQTNFEQAAQTFESIKSYKNSSELAKECREQADICRKDDIYNTAKMLMNGTNESAFTAAIENFEEIPGWKDSDELIVSCHSKIEEIKAKEELDRLEAERKAEEKRIVKEKAAKKRKKIIAVLIPSACVIIALVILLITVVVPNQKYKKANNFSKKEQYEEAYLLFEKLGNYKDSAEKVKINKYNFGISLIKANRDYDAYTVLKSIKGFKDTEQILDKFIVKPKIKSSGNETTVYEYDSNGFCIKESHSDNQSTYEYNYTYEFDSNGNCVKKVTTIDNHVHQSDFEYENNILVKQTDTDYFTTQIYEFNKNGDCIKTTSINGPINETRECKFSYKYDDNGNCIFKDVNFSEGNYFSIPNTPDYTVNYEYDNFGN